MSNRLRIAVAAVLVAVVVGLVPAPTASAGEAPTTGEAPEAPSIIPRPNRGAEPDDPGDRGGALQALVFGAIVVGVVGIGALIVRESRRSRQDRDS